MDDTKKSLTICLFVFIVGTLACLIGYLDAKITTFEECEEAGWLVRSIRVYDGYGQKECLLWSGKSFVKEISRDQQRAVEIATAHLSFPVTIIEVKKLECQGCFSVQLLQLQGDKQRLFTIVLDNWELKNVDQSDNANVLPAPYFPTQKEPATSYMQALLSDKPEELIIKDGCLRAGGYLLVWPYGFSLSADKDGIFQVNDSTGQPVAQVGDKVRIVGGEMSGVNVGNLTQYSEEFPGRCSGLYWIVAEVISVEKSTSPVAAAIKSVPSYIPGQAFDEATGNLTKKWDTGNFKGFWHDPDTGASTENLVINQSVLNSSYRVIEKHNLIYTTKPVLFKYQVYAHANLTPPGTDGSYSAIGWQGERYLLLDKNRIARVLFEQDVSDVKIITTGYLWAFDEGYGLFAHSIEAPLEREAWIEFLNGTDRLDEQVLPDRYLYSYPADESEIPIFITYISSIHRSSDEDLGELKYTWLRSQNITRIREGEILDAMEVISVQNGIIELRNTELIKLIAGTEIHLMGNIDIQVGTSETELQFYPIRTLRI